MARKEMLTTTVNGNELKVPVSRHFASMVIRLVDRNELENLWGSRVAVNDIAKKFDVASSAIDFLVAYYELPSRVRPVGISKSVDIDALAERLWLVLEARVKKLIEDAVEQALK